MRIPLILLKHLAKAYLNLWSGGVAGELVFGIADDVMKHWKEEVAERSRRTELEAVAQATTGEIKEAVAEVVQLVASDCPEPQRRDLADYLMQVPGSIRRTLRRPADPTGHRAPQGLALATAEDLVPLLPGRLPRFRPGDCPLAGVDRELVELLGVGGFGEVWKAKNPNRPSMPPTALKFCLDPAAKDRLLRHEARLLDRVMKLGTHPGIVALKETYLKADPPCLEYEYVGGGELTGLIRQYHDSRGGLSLRGAAKIVGYLARTVGRFHRLDPPIVHRDLKPANILVTTDGQGRVGLKIADFGIGGLAAGREIERAQSRQSHAGSLCSIAHGSYTPLYASPEQVRGASPDPRDDVHALGVIWHQLLTGEISQGAPTGLDWTEDLTARGMAREQIELLASCFSSRQERRPTDAQVLAERIEAAFQLGENKVIAAAHPAAVSPPDRTAPPREVRDGAGDRSGTPPSDESGEDSKPGALATSEIPPPAELEESEKDEADGASELRRLRDWEDVRRKLGFDPVAGAVAKKLLAIAMRELEVENFSDPALSVNWRDRKALAVTYGVAKVLNIERKPGTFEVWVCVPAEDADRIDPRRRYKVWNFGKKYSPVVLVYLRTGATPALTELELDLWWQGLGIVREIARGSRNPFLHHKNSIIGPWLEEFIAMPGAAAHFTARGPLERFGKDQWNVLVRNAEEMAQFWKKHAIKTKLDWAGLRPPKATVSRRALVERCELAGEGAEVEYEMKVQDRASGRGVTGVDLRIVGPPVVRD